MISAFKAANALTVEAWIKPAASDQEGPARIVTVSADPFNRNLTLGQEFGAYDMRLRTTHTSENGVPSLVTPDGLATPDLVHLLYTRDAAGQATIYRNGEVVAQDQVTGNLLTWDDGFRLALANELSQDRPWLGEYHRVAFFDRALSEAEIASRYEAGPRAPVAVVVAVPVVEGAAIAPLKQTPTAVSPPAPTTEGESVRETAVTPSAPAPSPSSNPTTPWLLIFTILAALVIVVLMALRRQKRPSN